MNIKALTEQINEAAKDYRVGGLQQFRRQLWRKKRGTGKIFTNSTIKDNDQ